MNALARHQTEVLCHLRAFFDGHAVELERWAAGPIEQRLPGFRVAKIGPGPRMPSLTTYVTVGAWAAQGEHEHGLEFVLVGPDHERLVELATIAAYYHAGPSSQALDHGHSVPIGEPWLEGSLCGHLLVCLPYPFGPELERCGWESGHARLLWLLPITSRELEFKKTAGLEALESSFDSAGLEFWNPARPDSVETT